MCGFSCKKKERKVLNSSLYSLTHRNARTIKLVSLRVRHIRLAFLFCLKRVKRCLNEVKTKKRCPKVILQSKLFLIFHFHQ